MNAAKVLLTVTAGVLPTAPEEEATRRWSITSEEWDAAGDDAIELLAERNGQAQGYAALLMMQPNRFNWVRTDWIWL